MTLALKLTDDQITAATVALIVSVVSALFTTLAVEYFAKPRLEARKERILGILRKREELISTALDLALAAKWINLELPKEMAKDVRESAMTDKRRRFQRMTQAVEGLMDNIGAYAGLYREPVLSMIGAYITTGYAVGLSARSWTRKAELIGRLSELVGEVISDPSPWKLWRIPGRLRAFFKLQRLVAAIEAEADDNAPRA